MSRMRLFTLLTACVLVASAAWADDLGYVDCASHPESVQLFGKARQTPDTLGNVACGERFTILVYGFVFSRVQTKDGKIGYIYSNLITPDRSGAVASPAAARVASPNTPAMASSAQRTAAGKTDSPRATTSAPEKPAAQVGSLFPTPPMPAVTPSDWAPARSLAANIPSSAAASQPGPTAPEPSPASAVSPVSQPQPAASATQPARAPAGPSSGASTAPAADALPAAPAPSQPSSPAQADSQAQSTGAEPAPAQSSAGSSATPPQESSPAEAAPMFPNPPQPATPAPPSGVADAAREAEAAGGAVPAPARDPAPASAVAEPTSRPAASQPEGVQPAPEPARSTTARSSWERPLPGVHQSFLVELYSGYAFDRVSGGGTSSNLSGGMGSFGYNLKPWLQIVGDTSYNLVSSGNVKNVLYGNHFGGRVFYQRNRWGMTPFAEGLVGGSRFDVTVSGASGYKTSDNCLSYKAGGGIDIRFRRHWEIRLIDVDYYHTSFGGTTQNNYWASAGVVLRLFGGGASE